MATNMMGNTPARGGNDMPMGGMDNEQGEGEASVTCLHIYKMQDGSFRVSEAQGEPVPSDAEPMQSLDEVMQEAQQYFTGSDTEAENEGMEAAKSGYAKRASRPMMSAPNPGGIFGE